MTRLSSANLELLRTQPQSTKLYLSIFQPQIIFTAQINDSVITRGAVSLPYDNASGTYTNIESGMTLWVGSTPGAQDIGKIRIRSGQSSFIEVSENSNIDWRDNLYLTVYKFWELWPIFPRIQNSTTRANDIVFLKDYNILYTNQNSVLGTLICAGPHRAALLDPASNLASIYYSSTGSYNVRGDSLSYNWSFEGGTPSTSTAATPGYVSYNTPGQYITKLIISGSSGSADVTQRYVSIYKDPPINKWIMEGPNGARDEGGYRASFKIFENIDIQQNAVVVVFGQNYYGNTLANLGGNAQNAGDIFYVGYIDKDTISYDYEHSEVSFDAVSITDTMKKSSGFSISVQSVANPTKWYELLDMDGRRALYHYLRWHTTALLFNDFQFIGTDPRIQFFDSDRESMYDAVHNYMSNALLGNVVADRQGKIWAEINADAYINPTGTFTPVMDITRRDWLGTPNIEERLNPEVSYAEYGGVAYSGTTTGTFSAMIGSAPGNAPGFYGAIDNHEGMALLGQSQLNSIVGNVVANKNSSFPTISFDSAINAGNLDIAPQEAVGLHIARDDTVRHLKIDGLYIPNSMSWKYNSQDYRLLPNISSKQLVSGIVGETVTIPPVTTTDEGGFTGGWDVPPFDIVLPPVITFPPSTLKTLKKFIVADVSTGLGNLGILYTQTLDSSSPIWTQINNGLSSTDYALIEQMFITPNGAFYVMGGGFADRERLFLARAPYVGGTFVVIINKLAIDDFFGPGSLNSARLTNIAYNPSLPEEVIFLAGNSNGAAYFKVVGASFQKITALNSIATPNGENNIASYGGGLFLAPKSFLPADISVFPSTTYTPITARSSFSQGQYHVRAGGTGKMLFPTGLDLLDANLRFTVDSLQTFTDYTGLHLKLGNDIQYQFRYKMAIDDSGSIVLTRRISGHGDYPSMSLNGGFSFNDVASSSVLGLGDTGVTYAFCGGSDLDSRWMTVGGGSVMFNPRLGDGNWVNKVGNIPTLKSDFSGVRALLAIPE